MPTQNEKSNLQPRPPVVAIVGHVDHGKTTLLDYIRKTSVAQKEAGGITQSIGAYEIWHTPTLTNADGTQTNAEKLPRKSALSPRESALLSEGKKITFIDTPGHEAFTLMRARGATAADLAVLVVAADDGVMAQTKEAIEILKKTETPFIVAITKVDSPNANIEKVKNDLLTAEVLLEGYGGNVSWHGVSGKTGEGVNDLLDLIILAGEVAGLTFNPEVKASGFIIESKKESRRGIVAHLVLKDGILREGEPISTSSAKGKIKILEDFLGRRVKELQPSAPAVVVGFEEIPRAGEEFATGEISRGSTIAPAPNVRPINTEETPRQRAILKADTSGSLEAMETLLKDLVEIGEVSVGEISDNDVNVAKATSSIIIGFRVEATKSAARLADSQQVKIITSDVIYKLVDAVADLMKAKDEEKTKAFLEVLAVFSVTSSKKTVGGKVLEGALKVGHNIEIERDAEVLGRGKITNIQCDKENAKEVSLGNECGLVVETGASIEVGDTLRVI
ncbi:MAG: GTP-binding protein [Candidatus Colwellbacteria bacterium]|nr:GTP-binding protein [Candidatus Colwellbacteria bacterium]